jgi:hypothetical protein
MGTGFLAERQNPRQQRLAAELERVSIDAELLARRIQALNGLRPRVRQQAEHVAKAAYAIGVAAVAMHGGLTTQPLRDTFGKGLSVVKLDRVKLLGESDADDD